MSQRMLISIIADRETAICFLLAGIGEQQNDKKNYLIVEDGMSDDEIFKFFDQLYIRKDICVIFIGNEVAQRMNSRLANCDKDLPIIMKIPSKKYLEKINEQLRFSSQNVEEISDIFEFES